MSDQKRYQLIDFGQGRKLEQMGKYLIDRPCPAALGTRQSSPSLWTAAHGRYERGAGAQGRWLLREGFGDRWQVALGPLRLELQTTASGQVGFFPEETDNWQWLARQLKRPGEPASVLNLFAYTGGSSLSAAAAGATVVHVDSSKSAVAWARRNAVLSGLGDAPIRWIVEDVVRFVRREIRRGNRYDAIILDPPSYGHGPKGEVWKIERDLGRLLADCAELVRGRRPLVLLTCHTRGLEGPALCEMLHSCLSSAGGSLAAITHQRLEIRSRDGRNLASGAVARFPD